MEGGIGFGFWNPENSSATVIDSTYGTFYMQTKTLDYQLLKYVALQEIELTNLSRENNPEYFENDVNDLIKDTRGFVSAKDFSGVVV